MKNPPIKKIIVKEKNPVKKYVDKILLELKFNTYQSYPQGDIKKIFFI